MVNGRARCVRSSSDAGEAEGAVGSKPVHGTESVVDGEGVMVRCDSEPQGELVRVQVACGQSFVPSRTPSIGGRTVKVFVPETTA